MISVFSHVRRQLAVLTVVVCLLATVPVASAQTVGSGTVTVPAGTVHEGDLSVFTGTVVVAGTVTGDLDGAAGSVLVTGTGTVEGDLAAAAGAISVQGVVGGTVEGAAGSVVVAEGARVGAVETASGSLTVDGTVLGDVTAAVDTLTVGETAAVGGQLRHDATTLSVAPGTVAGGVQRVDGLSVASGIPFLDGVDVGAGLPTGSVAVFGFLVNLVLGAALLLGAPGFARRVVDTGSAGTTGVLRSGLAGVLALVGIPIGLVVLAVTVVGLPLSLAGLVVYLVLLWVGFVYGALVAGDWLTGLAGVESRWAALGAGLAVPVLAAFVPLGGVVTLAYLLLGLGAFALSALALRRGGEGPADPDTETPESARPA